MRTETEMHDLVLAKVAAHRRRTLLASAGGGVAAVLLLVAVVAGAAGTGPDEGVKAGPGDDPAPTTEEPTTTPETTEAVDDPTPSSVPAPSTQVDPAPTTTPPPAPTEPDATTTTVTTSTTEAPTTQPPTTTTAPPAGPSSTVVSGAEGDLQVRFTVTTDPSRPGTVSVRVQATDPTGVDAHPGWTSTSGPGGMIGVDGEWTSFGDVPASCGHGDLEGVEPAAFDEVVELRLPAGPHRLTLRAFTLPCHAEADEVLVEHEVLVP